MLEDFTVDTFSPLVGSAFVMHVDPQTRLRLNLIEAVPLGAPERAAPAETRQPFSLMFRGPRAPVAIQRIYQLENPSLGTFGLFLVPVGLDQEGMQYQAIFT